MCRLRKFQPIINGKLLECALCVADTKKVNLEGIIVPFGEQTENIAELFGG